MIDIIYQIRRDYIQRYIAKKFQVSDLEKMTIDSQEILKKLSLQNLEINDLEMQLAKMISEEINLEIIEKVIDDISLAQRMYSD